MDAIPPKAALRVRSKRPDLAHEQFTWISARLLRTGTVKLSARATDLAPEKRSSWLMSQTDFLHRLRLLELEERRPWHAHADDQLQRTEHGTAGGLEAMVAVGVVGIGVLAAVVFSHRHDDAGLRFSRRYRATMTSCVDALRANLCDGRSRQSRAGGRHRQRRVRGNHSLAV